MWLELMMINPNTLMKSVLKYFVLIGFIILPFACAQQANINLISVEELKSKMQNDSSLVILDVRNPEELSGPLGKLDGVINIPVQELEDRLSELEKYRNSEIEVICRTGRRSGIATELLIENGYNARNVVGGMVEYRQSEHVSQSAK